MGHNLCLDIFGTPSPEEFSAGLTAHGEGSLVGYDIESASDTLVARARIFRSRISLSGAASTFMAGRSGFASGSRTSLPSIVRSPGRST
jgi:hypothetical protein